MSRISSVLSSALMAAAVSLTLATPSQAAPNLTRSSLRINDVNVSVRPDLRVFALRSNTLDAPALRQHAARALAKTPDVRVESVTRLVSSHGLFVLTVSRALTLPEREVLQAGLESTRGIQSLHPVHRRLTGRVFTDDHLVVKTKPGQLAASLPAILAATDGTFVRKARLADTALIRVGAKLDHDAARAADVLAAEHGTHIVRAEADLYRELRATALTDDPLLASQWHLARQDGTDVPGTGEIFADEAWDITMGNPAVVVAVFDSGTDMNHPDLVPNIVGGFDAADGDEDPNPECSRSQDGRDVAASCPNNAPFRESHGTAVSGTIAARGDNGIGVAGVCPMCSLLPVRLLGGGGNSGLSTAEAFVRAVDEGADILNNSWGPGLSIYFPLSGAMQDALVHARTTGRDGKGTIVLFAAGNDSSDVVADAYAASPLTLAVAASTNLDDWASYSNYGSEIDFAAPSRGGAVSADSHGIGTTDVLGDDGYDPGDYAPAFGGTSAACPVAAGVAGLILSVNPALTAAQVRILMTSTADKITADKVDWVSVAGQDLATTFAYDDTGHSIGFGFGRVNAARAVAAAQNPGLQGATCDTPGCPVCGPDDTCEQECTVQGDCPSGSMCRGGSCTAPRPGPTDIGQPCTTDCEACVGAVSSDFESVDLCTASCASDSDCPTGFDCRLIREAQGGQPEQRYCAVGSDNAGERDDLFNCRVDGIGAVVVEGDNGEGYCTSFCFTDGPGSCPHGFECGAANCECTGGNGQFCWEYTCSPTGGGGNFYPMCFPKPGYGSECLIDDDCAPGDYCRSGSCTVDDRAGCEICASCTTDAQCGENERCLSLNGEDDRRCTRGCDTDADCPGSSTCELYDAGRFGTLSVCAAPDGPELCPADFTCDVQCRDDVPCPAGQMCTDGACAPIPAEVDAGPTVESPDAGSTTTVSGGGCGCDASQSSGAPVALGALMLALLARRRRRG